MQWRSELVPGQGLWWLSIPWMRLLMVAPIELAVLAKELRVRLAQLLMRE